MFDEQISVKCQSDKETLVRLKHQAKNLKTQHCHLKKQVLKEAQLVKEIDDELTQLLEKHR